jgi:biopolymer transport protein ExbD
MLSVAVDAHGKYAINGTAAPFRSTQDFSAALREAAKGNKDPIIAISADAAATHQSVINVMESARLAGYNHISFTTQTRR